VVGIIAAKTQSLSPNAAVVLRVHLRANLGWDGDFDSPIASQSHLYSYVFTFDLGNWTKRAQPQGFCCHKYLNDSVSDIRLWFSYTLFCLESFDYACDTMNRHFGDPCNCVNLHSSIVEAYITILPSDEGFDSGVDSGKAILQHIDSHDRSIPECTGHGVEELSACDSEVMGHP
jgi:hypothetical protein